MTRLGFGSAIPGAAIPGVRHSGRQPFGDGSVSPKGQQSEGSLSESFYFVNVLALSVCSDG